MSFDGASDTPPLVHAVRLIAVERRYPNDKPAPGTLGAADRVRPDTQLMLPPFLGLDGHMMPGFKRPGTLSVDTACIPTNATGGGAGEETEAYALFLIPHTGVWPMALPIGDISPYRPDDSIISQNDCIVMPKIFPGAVLNFFSRWDPSPRFSFRAKSNKIFASPHKTHSCRTEVWCLHSPLLLAPHFS